jgi:hypothetical protein
MTFRKDSNALLYGVKPVQEASETAGNTTFQEDCNLQGQTFQGTLILEINF